MKSSVHLQINERTLDKWSTREQLCLASAVLNSDLDWTTVSCNVKNLCGNNRPADWFSHKSCAAQYEDLLENIERQKNNAQSIEEDIAVDTSHENSTLTTKHLILKQLTKARMEELEAEIRKEQEEYARISAEIKLVESGQLKDEEIAEMWKEIQKEQEMQRIEEMKLENQLREREQRNQDMQRNWTTNVGSAVISPNYDATKKEEKNLSLQEIIGTSKIIPSIEQQQATSPLLSSLLKSPTPTCSSPTVSTIAHVTAPTITTLLTGGAINPNKPAITLKNTIPASEAAHLLSRPISGPPTESMSVLGNASHNLLSPSQSAPTLSMLLEKNKVTNILNTAATNISTTSSVEPANVSKIACSVSDSNNEEVPMDIEEDVVTAVATDLIGVDDSDADANEEQQLLEVFKNIGNIDDLEDIDVAAVINEEVDFLKSVEEEPADRAEEVENEKCNLDQLEKLPKNPGTANKAEEVSELKDKEAHNIKKIVDDEIDEQKEETKIETTSSDDSNDDIPLSTLGSNTSLSNKEVLNKSQDNFISINTKEQLHGYQNEDEHNNDENRVPNDEETVATSVNGTEEHDGVATESETTKEVQPTSIPLEKSPHIDNSDVIIIPTDDESNGDCKQEQSDKSYENKEQQQSLIDDVSTNDISEDQIDKYKDLPPSAAVESVDESTHSPTKEVDMDTQAPTVSLADTDDDSSHNIAVSTTTQNDEKVVAEKPSTQSERDNQEANNVDRKLEEETTFNQTPAKPSVGRKLRENDHSHSPITNVDDDTTASEHSVTQRSRRRCSSTPLIDSIPNSPTPSDRDDRDAKSSKKSLLIIYNSLMGCKSAAAFQRAYSEQSAQVKEVCKRNIDFQIIKKNIETGSTRSVYDLQRDFLLLCQNGIMSFKTNSTNYKIVCDFKQDCQNVKEFISNGNSCGRSSRAEKENKDIRTSTSSHASSTHSSVVKGRGSSRKSQRITST